MLDVEMEIKKVSNNIANIVFELSFNRTLSKDAQNDLRTIESNLDKINKLTSE